MNIPAPSLDPKLIAARARGEVLLYIPTHVRRERAHAVTFAAIPAPWGAK